MRIHMVKVSHQLMSQHGVPWHDTASVSVSNLQFKVNAVVGAPRAAVYFNVVPHPLLQLSLLSPLA